jgi:hypothetical protein
MANVIAQIDKALDKVADWLVWMFERPFVFVFGASVAVAVLLYVAAHCAL